MKVKNVLASVILFLIFALNSPVLAQSKVVYRQTDYTVNVSDLNGMVVFSEGKSKSLNVYIASSRGGFPVGAKINFLALTDVPIKLSAKDDATLISPENSFMVSSYGSQWSLTHLGRNIWVASGDLYSTEINAYLNEHITLRANVDDKATGPFTFVWRKNGRVISGVQSSTLKLLSLKSSDAGLYSVTVSNSAGVVSSEAMQLIVR
jgi:hypothetical protein